MKLDYLMTFRATLKDPVVVGGVHGKREVYDVTGGEFEGPRLRGRILPSGGDWVLYGSDGWGRLDVRMTLETHDGARIYAQYLGVIGVNEHAAESAESQFGDTYFATQPRFDTADSRYEWINRLVTVAEGRDMPNAVEYRVFAVMPSP